MFNLCIFSLLVLLMHWSVHYWRITNGCVLNFRDTGFYIEIFRDPDPPVVVVVFVEVGKFSAVNKK